MQQTTRETTFTTSSDQDSPRGKGLTQKITPCLWFDNQAEEAAKFYVSVFKNSKLVGITHYDKSTAEVAGRPVGSVLTVDFELDGQKFVALNGGPIFQLSEAVSFMVNVETEEELDYYWEKLSAGGVTQPCGWLKDKFGLSWQVVPAKLNKMIHDPDPKRFSRVMAALMQMSKIDIKELERAYEGAG